MKKLLWIAFICIFTLDVSFSQNNNNLKETFQEAEYYILYDDYEEAIVLYQKLISNGMVNAYINHRIGECYLNIPGQKHKAIPYLEKACENISEKIKEGSFKETNAPTRTLFYLGDAYQINNDLDKAIETYQRFKDSLHVKDIYNLDYVNQQILSCENAKNLLKNPVSINKLNVGETINNNFSNVNAVVSSNDQYMVFISELKFYDAIFFSEKIGENWGTPINITPDIKSDGDYFPCYLSPDGDTLLLFRYDGYSGDLYLSKFDNGKWQVPNKLSKNINSKSLETHGCLSADGKTIYFVSDRKGGYGGLDIYKSTFNETLNDWGEAVNLGPEINTALNEETPQISEDGKILYFSSQGHYNMGGFDIFHSSLIGENEWTTPVNIGYPINTTDDDVFYYPIKNGKFAYFSVYDKDGFGQNDIFKYDFVTPAKPSSTKVSGTVSLQDNQTDFLKDDFYVCVLDSSKAEIIKKLHLEENTGRFETDVLPGTYYFIFNSKEYKKKIKAIVIPQNYSQDELVFNVELVPLEVTSGEYIAIKSIFFGFDDYTLTKEAKTELERLYNLMIKYPSLQIEIIGHTDSRGSQKYNKELSIKRTQSVISYLSDKGINKSRFAAKGKGMEQPIAINKNADGSDNPEGRKFNRRVEMKVLKSDDKIVISSDYNIPEHLKLRELNYYIFLTRKNKELPEDYFDSYKELKDYKITKHKNTEYIYTVGNCKNKSELIVLFNTVLDLGFDDAEIISNYDLKELLQ